MKETTTNRRRSTAAAGAMAALCCGLAFSLPSQASAPPGQHPDYGKAYGDLSTARGLLNVTGKKSVIIWEKAAVFNISKSLYEISSAAKTGKETMKNYPSPMTGGNSQGKMQQALDFEQSALTELQSQEDDKAALGWRKVAISHVESSMKMVHQAITLNGSGG